MEVTKSNFKESLPIFQEAVEECDFLAIDTELTGLKTAEEKEHAFDTMEERYLKAFKISKGFLIIQFGVSCFKYHKDENKYTHKDFNFYVFPRPHSRHAPDPIFICQPSSLLFLTNFEFDFNKMIHNGISYIMPHEEEKWKNSLKVKHDEENITKITDKNRSQKERKDIRVPDEQRNFLKLIHQKINNFVKDETQTTLHLPPCSNFQRKLIYQTVDQNSLGVELSTQANDSRQNYILVEKASEEEKLQKLILKQKADVDELEDAVGFRKVMEAISESQKLVIGHNMLLDIFHSINQFFHPLPDNLRDFKDLVKSIFPRLMDTKTLASSSAFKEILPSTSLSEVLIEFKKNKYKGTVESTDDLYNIDMDKMHEAGFDAFITGFCFIKLALALRTNPDINKDCVTVEASYLKSYMNRPFIMQHFDVQSLNLCGPDPEATREHVFYISFPKEWKTMDIVELFLPYGGIYISWLNDTSALIALKSPEQSINVKRVLLKELNSKFNVKTYSEYQAMTKTNHPFTNSQSLSDEATVHKRRKTTSNNLALTPVHEQGEPLSESKQDSCVSTSLDDSEKKQSNFFGTSKAKKMKVLHEETEANEVSSTEKLFEEPANW